MEEHCLAVRCKECLGTGLLEKTRSSPCSKCSEKTGCMYCQNKNKGMYQECDKCYGTGELPEASED
jgi:DnaJ-class molecular chaperone